MATALKLRRGTTSQHSTFTGAEGEVTVDTTKDTVVVHDGATAGGFPLATEKGANTFTANQIISVTDNTNAALRITQAGTGDALLVEDEANPDSTPFVIKNDGKVGIGVSVPSYPLDITLLEATSRIYSTQAGKGAMRLFSTTTGTMYVGKDYEGSSGWWGSGGEYVIAGTGNYPIDFHTNSVKRLSILGDGNINIPGTARRITGDLSNTTETNRLSFQSTTTDGSTQLNLIPNGTSRWSGLYCYNTSDPANAALMSFNTGPGAGAVQIRSEKTGTGTLLPMQFIMGGTAQMVIATNGDLQFNSGYGSSAVAYGCRAWVNFDGTSNATNLTGTYSQTGTTVTVTITGHGYITGNSAFLDFTSGTAVDGAYTVTVTDANTFTVTQASRTTSGNVTNVRNNIFASGNVSSISDNGTGIFTVNFTNSFPDTNYAIAGYAKRNSDGDSQQAMISSRLSDSKTTSSVLLRSGTYNAYIDSKDVSIAFFR
jgi:hypothetical protein